MSKLKYALSAILAALVGSNAHFTMEIADPHHPAWWCASTAALTSGLIVLTVRLWNVPP